jgi:hypothetical protein
MRAFTFGHVPSVGNLRFEPEVFGDFYDKEFVEIASAFDLHLVGALFRRNGFHFDIVISELAIGTWCLGLMAPDTVRT